MVPELIICSGQEEARLQPVGLSGLVEKMSALLKTSIPGRSSLHLDLCADLPSVLGNASQIRRLLMKLVANASQAIGDHKGVVPVKTSLVMGGSFPATGRCRDPEEDHIRSDVSYPGCGMTEEEKARIFDPFFTTQ